ncbi:GAF domain-containing protein [Sinisalibacter aestuarii]|uniref:GAF domain-containing protein n=1 Tax=Sinisalibacter aestuarii TaxID=2949426 RepID=A0ABQ5LSW6_9RHOB|nr:GAF domain-containing protein [Sinisalibacter aestuarii]GKY87708.1 hypothetical protein STA1M1_15770 [Sinisalibacter aestuarii]
MTDTAQSLAAALSQAATALATPGAEPGAVIAPVAEHLIRAFDLGLVTVTHRDPSDGSFLRLYSSMPGAYEAQGRKPANETEWSRQVIDEQKSFVANDYEGLAQVMFDHEKIRSLGLESILNIPIVVAGDVVGTLNCLGPAGHFSDEVVAGCTGACLPVAAALMIESGAPG